MAFQLLLNFMIAFLWMFLHNDWTGTFRHWFLDRYPHSARNATFLVQIISRKSVGNY